MKNIAEMDTIHSEFPRVTDSVQPPEPFSSLVRVEFAAVSDIGKKRQDNEDAYIYYRQARLFEKIETSLKQSAFPDKHWELGYHMAVADGMGGAQAGEVASSMVLTVAVNLMLNAPNWLLKLDNPEFRGAEIERFKRRAQDYFRRIDEALLKQAETYPQLKGMGSTLTAAHSVGDDLFTLHVGDSRAYLYRANKLIR